jgi:hypothetical protein
VKEIVVEAPDLGRLTRNYSQANGEKLRRSELDRKELVKHPIRCEKLDQLTVEVLPGVRYERQIPSARKEVGMG